MISRLGSLLPRIILQTISVSLMQKHLLSVLVLMIVPVMMMRQSIVKFADDGIGANFGPVVILVMMGHCVNRRPEASSDDGWSFVSSFGVFLHVFG